MKKSVSIVLIIFACLVKIAPRVSDPPVPWQAMTVEEARQAVQKYRQKLKTPLILAEPFKPRPDAPPWQNYYQFKDERYTYEVCAYNPHLFRMKDRLFDPESAAFYGEPVDPIALRKKQIPEADAERIARKYLQAHFPYPHLLNAVHADKSNTYVNHLSLGVSSSFVSSYRFWFHQKYNGNITGPAECVVEVDAIKGRVVSGRSEYFPTTISLTPALTDNQVLEIAAAEIGIPAGYSATIGSRSIESPDVSGKQRLVYYVFFQSNELTIDANDGTVLGSRIEEGIPILHQLWQGIRTKVRLP